jgi:hypothetical protein
MKALVVTNCATAAYTAGLRAIFPDWDVKGAQLDVARKWLTDEPNPAFGEFLGQVMFLITSEPDNEMFAQLPPGATRLVIPVFYFRGYHPDSFHLGSETETVPSVLRSGNLHSRIAATASVLGLTQEDAIAAFNGRVYERIGYLSVVDRERAELFERFAADRIQLATNFNDWIRYGNFLYTYNHPVAFVFNDILLAALAGRFLDLRRVPTARQAMADIPDFLAPSLRWPVYPEIAEAHGFTSEFVWRTGENSGAERMGIEEFVARSYAIFASCPSLAADWIPGFDRCREALIG